MKQTITPSATFSDKLPTTGFTKSLFIFFLIFGIQNSFAQTNTWDGSSSNSWSTAANWSLNHAPTSGEDVVIPDVGTDPRYAVSTTTVKSITIQSGGNLVFERATAYALIVTGTVNVNAGGTFTMRTAGASAVSTLTVGGDFVNNGTVDFIESSVINVNFNGAAAQTISGTGTTMDLYAVTLTNASSLIINRAIDVDSNWTNNGKTVSGTGSVNFGGTTTIGGTTSTSFPNLNIAGTVTQGINTSVSGDYNQTAGTYNQNTGATAYSLTVTGNFTMSGSSIFNMQTSASGLGATTTVNGATGTTLSGTARIAMDSGGAVAANVSIFQTTNFISSSTANTSTGIIDFGSEANVKNNQFRISGNCSKTGSTGRFYTSAAVVNGGLVFNGSGATQIVTIVAFVDASRAEYYNVTVNSGAVVQLTTSLKLGTENDPASSFTLNGTLDAQTSTIFGGDSGTFLFGTGSTLKTANVNGISSGLVGTISTSFASRIANSTVNYIFSGAANQTANFFNTGMNNLTISNTGGSVILNAAPTVNGTLAVTAGTLDSAGFQIIGNATNNFTLASGTTFRTSGGTTANFPTLFTSAHCIFNAASTVEYYGTTQTVSATPTYGNLSFSAAGTKTAGGSLSIAGNLSIASGAIANLGSTTTHTAATLTLGGLNTAAGKFGSTSNSATAPVYKNNTYFTAGTTGYITVATGNCTAPTITFGTIPSICPGATSLSLPYTAITGSADLYSIAGSGITTVTNGALAAAPSSIGIGLSSPAVAGTISSSSFTVSSSITGCVSANINGSVTVNPSVGTPSIPSPAATTICQASTPTAYTTSATNATSYTWSVTGSGNSISGTGTTGTVTWASGFSGSATVSVVANGCNGPSSSASTTVTVTPTVGTPSTPSPAATTICQASAPTAYTTSATNATSYVWTVSGTGNTISGTGTTGTVTWASGFTGSATVSVRANGCNGPSSLVSTTVTVTATVGTPSFTVGTMSLCQNASNTTYTATATNNTGITYSVLPVAAGTIGSGNGIMDWDANYSGSATITATVTGCNGPKTVDRVVTITPTVGTPNFTAGATTVCQDAASTTYTATATDTTGITYTVSPGTAGTISSTTGLMNWSSTYSGTAIITASAAGCNGPKTNTRSVTVTPTVGATSFTAGATTVCQNAADETYTATSTNNTGITYSVSPGTAGSIDSDSGVMDWSPTFTGNATITALSAGCNGPTAANRIVTVTPTVGTPGFTAGATTVCQDAANTTYAATATNSTAITYTVSPPAAGTIGSSSGIMDWNSSFNGTATITASAAGCNGPKTADRVVIVNPTVGTPGFTTGATTVCQDAADEIYTASAPGATAISYSVSPVGAGTIGSSNGVMNWNASFNGTATITASAAGCNGPKTANRVVTVTPTVGTPSFTVGATTVCQDATDTTYTATATDATGITYSLSPVGSGTIGSTSGILNWDANFSGTAIITATAAGCNGPKTNTQSVTVTPTVGTPTFTAGAITLCQDAADTTYTATATNTTGITYSISPIGAGTIGSSNGLVDWSPVFSGTATITASAAGCNGPKIAARIVTVIPEVGVPTFTAGAITLCQDATDGTYTATATDTTGITYSVSPVGAGSIGSTSGIMNWNPNFSGTATITASAAGCSGPATANRVVTVNPSPVVTASDVSGCSGSSIALSGSGTPSGGSGNYSVANPFVGTSSTTYTYTYTDTNGCSATSAPANITITPQPLWYLDSDGDQYYTGSAIASCTSPGIAYTMNVLGGNDCNDNDIAFNPGVTDICYNNIDENCNTILSDGCAPVIVNMTASYNNTTLTALSTAVPAVAYTYPGTTNIKYRFSIKNETTNTTAPDVIQTSRYVTIPASIHSYNSQYTIKVSAVINEEVVAFAGNSITINSPSIQLITLSSSNCGGTLTALTSTLSANPGLNATGYTFRIRLNDSNPNPTYAYSQSATRFVGANTFTGFPLQYSASYKIAVQYTSTDASTNLPVQSGYGAECTVNTPAIPLTNLASPTCGSQVATTNANISAGAAQYATGYQFRIRLFTDNGPNPTYYYTVPNASRFSSLASFQGISYAYNTNYVISVQYSILNGSTTVWSGYGADCRVKTPFFPVTSLIPNQCGKSTPTGLNEQLNISPYPGFPHYKVLLEEIAGEDVVNSEEREITYSHFRLSDFSIAQLGKSYAVSVAIKLNGVFGDYDTACDLFTEVPEKTATSVSFKATAYPNPFANNFMMDIKSTSQSSVNLKVYDMVGRLIEQREVRMSDIESTTIGNTYPTGVYNVVVSQENSVQTVRVVKR